MSDPIFTSINPFSGQEIGRYFCLSDNLLGQKLRLSQRYFPIWHKTPLPVKQAIFRHLAALLRAEAPRLAVLMSAEMGKHFREGLPEIEKSAQMCDYVAEQGPRALEKSIDTEGGYYEIEYAPLGTILGIMPWNYPFWQVVRFACATLMAGNTVVVKHAPNVGGCALALEALFHQAFAPFFSFEASQSIYQNLFISPRQVKRVLRSPAVQGVSLTGSTQAGQAVGSFAAKQLKISVLELGGNDAFIVLDDADIETAARQAIQSRMRNAGQSCLAPKRFLVTHKRSAAFIEALKSELTRLVPGDPLNMETQMGPLARPDIADRLWRQYQEALQKGAQVVSGGTREGNLFWPTLLRGGQPNMAIFKEETFGPLASVFEVKRESDLLRLAQQSVYGLGCAIWTADIEKARQWANDLNVGNVAINKVVRSAVHLPFGGVKASGYGREMGRWGFRAFSNVKVVSL